MKRTKQRPLDDNTVRRLSDATEKDPHQTASHNILNAVRDLVRWAYENSDLSRIWPRTQTDSHQQMLDDLAASIVPPNAAHYPYVWNNACVCGRFENCWLDEDGEVDGLLVIRAMDQSWHAHFRFCLTFDLVYVAEYDFHGRPDHLLSVYADWGDHCEVVDYAATERWLLEAKLTVG